MVRYWGVIGREVGTESVELFDIFLDEALVGVRGVEMDRAWESLAGRRWWNVGRDGEGHPLREVVRGLS